MSLAQALRRRLRPGAKRLQAVVRWKRLSFGEAPPVFGNSKPKSGSHLLLQLLHGLTQIMPLAYVQAEPIRSITKEGRRRNAVEILEDLRRIPRGVVGWGYLDPTDENVEFLCRPDQVNYFLYRDPRDLLVSQVFFATDMYEDHGMHAYYNSLPDFGSRLHVAITGIDQSGLKMVSVKQRYQGVLAWLTTPGVLCLRFEDLIEHPDETLTMMLDEVEKTSYRIPTGRPEAQRVLRASMQPRKSRTFRSGKVGGWREYFTPEHRRLFLDVAGDLLIRLGYEEGNDW
jgi:hypothetical protein